ncbi:MAG: helix-turn-helix domain-containing protein [Nitrospira sp.]|jgi:methylated-DNA-[protein]-cysteine S-methyltransferase|nr:MAG: helix-turn-helix domain-containing protein [Nitrospira sp.]
MPNKLRLLTETLLTPIGKLVVIYDDAGHLRAIDWTDYDDRMRRLLARHYGEDHIMLTPAPRSNGPASAIAAYFEGELHAIDSIPTATEGTPFQKRVWQALRDIPAGQTVSYGDLAKRIGQPAAVRAVGLANGANPIGIVVPCHRVIGADGSLAGYGGGLERKRWLLNHEMRALRSSSLPSA